jgi:hypothetical protein
MRASNLYVALILSAAISAGCNGNSAIASPSTASPSVEATVAVDCTQHSPGANLSECDFLNADFAGADLSGANLTRASFIGADLTGANLSGSDLSYGDFTGAKLTGAILTGAVATGAKFEGAILTDAIGVPASVVQELLRPACVNLEQDAAALDSAEKTWYDFFFPDGVVIKRDVDALDVAYKDLTKSVTGALDIFRIAGKVDILEKYARYVKKDYSLFKAARKSGFEYYSRVDWLVYRGDSSYFDAKLAVVTVCP